MKFQRARLEKDFRELATFGSLETGGFTRVAFSLEDIGEGAKLSNVYGNLLCLSIDLRREVGAMSA